MRKQVGPQSIASGCLNEGKKSGFEKIDKVWKK